MNERLLKNNRRKNKTGLTFLLDKKFLFTMFVKIMNERLLKNNRRKNKTGLTFLLDKKFLFTMLFIDIF